MCALPLTRDGRQFLSLDLSQAVSQTSLQSLCGCGVGVGEGQGSSSYEIGVVDDNT